MIEQILQADRLLDVDQVAQARSMYARVVELDPGNAIAVVGLARCALADGDDRGAHQLASRALGIDPQNDMARRMEARLAEILTARGEAVERSSAAALVGSDLATASSAQTLPPTSGPGRSLAVAERRSLLDRLMGR